MHRDEIHEFFEGESNPELLQSGVEKNSPERDFLESYREVIAQNNREVPDFDPFVKINTLKATRISIVKRLLPYAALVILILGTVLIYQTHMSNETIITLNEKELLEIQANTNMALLHLSQELNACLAKFDDAKHIQQPANELKQLKDFKINSNNPLINLKLK